MNFLDKKIHEIMNKGDIAPDSELYGEIFRSLTEEIGLNLAFFVFENISRSHCARDLQGTTGTCPVIALYLKFEEDFRQTGIDSHSGNWGDEWEKTSDITNAVNRLLEHHGYGDGYVSENTFVFVHTREELAFAEIGKECKGAIQSLVCDEAPGVEVTEIFWNGWRYDVILRDKADCKRVKSKVETRIAQAVNRILAETDENGYCRSYKARIRFGHPDGVNFFSLDRDDY